MKRMVKTAIVSLGITAGLLGGCFQTASALSVNPPRTELRLAPGKTAQGQIHLTNDSGVVQHMELSTKDWFVTPDNRAKKLTVDQWLELVGKRVFELKPGESRDVGYRVRCPKEAEGELVAMISSQYTSGEPSMVVPMISVSVYLEVAGTEKVAGEIQELKIHRWKNQWQAGVAIQSTGNVHLRPSGTIEIRRATGDMLGQYKIPEGQPTYPGVVQGYLAQIPSDLKLDPGRYLLKSTLTYRDMTWQAQRGFEISKDNVATLDPMTKEAKTTSP
jgi:hypothetical protein